MTTQGIIEITGAAAPALSEPVRELLRARLSPATRRAYRADLATLARWCERRGLNAFALSPAELAEFVADQVRESVAPDTLGRRIAAIRHAYHALNLPDPSADPVVREAVAGARRILARPRHAKQPLLAESVRALALSIRGDSAADLRDRALVLLGFAGAFRRSELCALRVDDLAFVDAGMRVTIRASKTDQGRAGETIAICSSEHAETCPVAAVRRWLARAGIADGFVFRRIRRGGHVQAAPLLPGSVADILVERLGEAGITGDFAAHSLRSGFLTSAARAGADLWKMMEVSRHRSVQTVRLYVRDAHLFDNHAGKGLL